MVVEEGEGGITEVSSASIASVNYSSHPDVNHNLGECRQSSSVLGRRYCLRITYNFHSPVSLEMNAMDFGAGL